MKDITVGIKGVEWKEILDHVYEHKKATIEMDGFRKGQVPKEVYFKKNGISALVIDAVDHSINKLYAKMLEENPDLNIACRPGIDIKEVDEEHLEITFHITEKPEVKLGKYKDLNIEKPKVEVTDEEIEHELGHLRERYVELKDKEGTVENNDEVNIDYEGFKDGVPFDGGKDTGYSLVIGSNTFIPGFEEGLIGLKKGEEKDLNLKFPENYHNEDLKGKEVVFKVKVNDIKTRVYPEYNKEFFDDLAVPGVDSLETLKDYIKKSILAHKQRDMEDEYYEKCLTKISEDAKIDVPKEMIEEEKDRMFDDFSERLKVEGMKVDVYLKMLNLDEAGLKDKFAPEATKRVRYRLCIEQIIKEEKIEVTEKEVEDYTKELAKRYQMTEEEFLKEIGDKEFIAYDLKVKKAMEVITK